MELERQARNIRGTINRARGLLEGKTVLYWPWTGSVSKYAIKYCKCCVFVLRNNNNNLFLL